MKLLFKEQVIEFIQDSTTEEVIDTINELLQVNYFFSHFVADGKEIHEDPETFLTTNLQGVVSLEIIALNAKDFINDLLLSAEEYSKRAVPHITTLSDEFYNNPSATSWAELSELFEGIQWLSSMVETIGQSTACPSNWNEVLTPTSAMQVELGNLEEALENTDTVLIADMLKYEILPVFEVLALESQKAIDTGGTRPDLN